MTPSIPLIVHATHEAGIKLGGIGAVLDGLLSNHLYNQACERTILVGPIDVERREDYERLLSSRDRLEIMYSTLPELRITGDDRLLADRLRDVELDYGVRLLYGRRRFGAETHELLLIDPSRAAADRLNAFKYELFARWGLDSLRYEADPEYNFYVSSADAGYAALRAVIGAVPPGSVLLAHEFMGVPLALAARWRDPEAWRCFYYAHEVPLARILIENHSGHDTRFYNIVELGRRLGAYAGDFFGDWSHHPKHALLMSAVAIDRLDGRPAFDALLAVGDRIIEELRFIAPEFQRLPIHLVYNGIPNPPVTLEAWAEARGRLQAYCRNLLGYEPDYLFTHVTRAIVSKALWRDVRVLEYLDGALAARDQRAVLFLLATAEPSGRDPQQVRDWERRYGWPVNHRSDNGDLLHHEVSLYSSIADYWTRGVFGGGWSRAIKIVLVNQFGWSRERCGEAMSEAMTFSDIRLGSDVEFGMSAYEPFGIATLEPLSAGALCVISNVCGSAGFLSRAMQRLEGGCPNIIIGDFTTLPDTLPVMNPTDIDAAVRDEVEALASAEIAQAITRRLPVSDADRKRLLASGRALAEAMSWDVVVSEYLLPALREGREAGA